MVRGVAGEGCTAWSPQQILDLTSQAPSLDARVLSCPPVGTLQRLYLLGSLSHGHLGCGTNFKRTLMSSKPGNEPRQAG